MGATDTKLSDVLLQAMQLEREGHAFYLAAAAQTESPAGREMFLGLARDELHHLEILDGVYRSWVGEGSWPSPESLSLEVGRRQPVFPPPERAAEVVAPRTGELDALRRGIDAEESSITLYQQGLETAPTPEARQIYQYLVEQEEGHRTILQGQYDYLTNTGFWFDIREFDLEAMG